MQDLIAALVSFFLIEPLQAEIVEKLAAGRAPQPVIVDVTACAASAVPVIVERAYSDPWRTVSSTVLLWIGSAGPDTVLIEAAPDCASAVEAARPFLLERVS
jgi:hypothetical protein